MIIEKERNKFLTPIEFGEVVGLSISTVYAMINDGEVETVKKVKIGSRRKVTLIPESEIKRLGYEV